MPYLTQTKLHRDKHICVKTTDLNKYDDDPEYLHIHFFRYPIALM